MPAVLPIAVAIVGAITEAGAIVGASIGALAGGALGLGAADTLALSASLGGVFGSAFVEGAGLFVLATASQLLESQPKIAGTQVDFMADPQTGVPYLFGRTGTGGKIVMTDSAGKNSAFLTYITVDSLGPIQGYESFQANTIVTQFDADNGEGAGHQTPTTTAQQPVPARATTIQVGTTDGFGTTSGTGISSSITISGGGNSETRTLSRVDQSPKELSWGTPLTHSYPEYAQITGSSVTSGFLNRMWLKESLGPANAPYLTFTSTDSKDTPANHSGIPTVWTSSCQLSGLAATMWTLEFDAQVYSGGTPRPLKVARGVFGYDPRLDSTYAGGSGTCRANNEATWVYSENPYVHALTWLIGRTANGVKTMGVHAPLNAIDIPAFVIGMNVADANGWKCGGVVMSTDSKWTVLTTMLQAGAGTPLKLGAKISCMVSTPLVSLDTLTGADVVGKATIAGTTPSRERINAIWPRYREEQQGWQIVPTQTPVIVASYVTVDGGQRTKETEYTLCQDASQAATLARYDIENAREIQPITLPCKPRWMGYKPGDCITVNEPEYELVNQTCLIVSREVDPATLITTLGLRTETFAKHAFALGQTGVAPVTPTMNGFDPSVFAGPLAGAWTATGGTIVSGAQTVPCINVTGASDNALAASVIFEYSEAGANDWQIWAETPAATTTGTQITGLAPNKAYDVGVCYRSVKGVISGLTVITPPDAASTGAGSYGAVVGSGSGNPGTLTSAAGGGLYIGDVVTAQGTSNNTSNVGSMSASAVNSGITNNASAVSTLSASVSSQSTQILALIATYGDTASAAASASDASAAASAATTAQTNAATAASNASAASSDAAAAQTAATTQATAAGVSASSASGSATAASGSAGAASVSAGQAATSASTAQTAATTATTQAGLASGDATAASTSATNAAASQTAAATSASSASSSASTATTQAGNASTSASAAATSATNAAGSSNTASTYASNASISQGAAGSSASSAATAASTATSQASNASGSAAQAASSATTAGNFATAAGGSATGAANSASSASSSSAAATASAAAAQQSATLSASVSGSFLNVDPCFAGYATASGLPAGWNDWSNGAAGTRSAGDAGGYAYRQVCAAGLNYGIVQSNIYITAGSYVIEAAGALEAGDYSGMGVYLQEQDTGAITAQLNMGTEPDNSGLAGNAAPGIRRFSKFINFAYTGYCNLYAMTMNTGFATGSNAKTFNWFKCAIRPASAAEVAGQQALTSATTNAANISSLSSVVASNQSAQASVNATLSAQVASNPNLLLNGGFANGFVGWGADGGAAIASATYIGNFANTADITATSVWIVSDYYRMDPGIQLTLSGAVGGYAYAGSGTCQSQLVLQFSDINQANQTNFSSNLVPNNSGIGGVAINALVTAVAPSNTHYFRVYSAVLVSGTGNFVGQLARVKVEQGANYTGWNDAQTAVALGVTVSTQQTAIATLGQVYGSYGVKVNANGAISALTLFAASGAITTSGIILDAGSVQINNAGVSAALFTAGTTYINAAVINSLSIGTSITVGSGAGIKVALQAFQMSCSDGQTVTYPADLSSLPLISMNALGLSPLSSGQNYSCYATSASSTGCVVNLKKVAPGTTTSQTSGSTSTVSGSGPAMQVAKTAGDAYNGNYNFNATIKGHALSGEPGYAQVDCFAFNGSAWTQIGSVGVSIYGGNSSTEWNVAGTIPYSGAIGSSGAYFGISLDSSGANDGVLGGSLVSFNGVTWQTQSGSTVTSASPNGETCIVTFTPTNGG